MNSSGCQICITDLKMDRTAQRESSLIYFDLKLAIRGQNDPTQASKIKKAENLQLSARKSATDDKANEDKPRITSSRGFCCFRKKIYFFIKI